MAGRSSHKKRASKGAQTGVLARNRRASYDYALEDALEAGIALLGSEVKALRLGDVSIQQAWVGEKDGELYLFNAQIGGYAPAANASHEPNRARKLLVKRRELKKLRVQAGQKGMSLVPLSLYFNRRGLAKLSFAPGKGKRQIDRRETIKQRSWKRRQDRHLQTGGRGRGYSSS